MKGINTMRYISFFILLLFSLSLHAQSQQPWEKYLDDLGELEDIESDNWESSYDLLSDLSAHPIDLNSITREDLEQLPFLTSEQIQDICEYVYKYAPLQSVHELSMVESLDVTRRKLL
ncbi:MAG: helix-hairpin-helix domain-containing protein, partial [Prevotella sp.]|nr:helix-hairpin-helix domain-containing protein [Prevotella sp.]